MHFTNITSSKKTFCWN